MFRIYNALPPPLMNNMFKLRVENPYNLRRVFECSRPMAKSICMSRNGKYFILRTDSQKNKRKLKTQSIQKGRLKHGSLITAHVIYLKFTLTAQDFSIFSKTQHFFNDFLCRVFILLSDLCFLFYGNIIYENFSKTLNILSFIFFYIKFFMFYNFFNSISILLLFFIVNSVCSVTVNMKERINK